MKKLDFSPAKSTEEFRSNYKLHDLSEQVGKNLLVQWGVEFKSFGEDKRYEKLWEKGEDKPDIILTSKGKSALLDWKGKRTKAFLVNERAIKSYERCQSTLRLPIIVAFLIFDEHNKLIDRRFAFLGKHKYVLSERRQWDLNKTVEFVDELPIFNKANILSFLTNEEE
ncbi:MAG: hypothetical protein FD143_1467 [Ignavibacteria bacterium]|nr:MAG: hypothetical protein FD143_1467 [Ignavibacteria bacterium]KAF0160517.1 MAG: hypothetical protein FD188_1691 [Ignavibacteria bacterium]